MKILSFDTSTRSIHTSLLIGRTPVYEQVLEPSTGQRQEAATLLLPQIDLALKAAGWRKKEIDVIVVGAGPGSFTGVRVALVTARTLGQGLNVGVIPVCFLEVVAAAVALPSAVVMPAGAGQYFGAAYSMNCGSSNADESLPTPLVEPFCAALPELLDRLDSYERFVGNDEMVAVLTEERVLAAWPEINNLATAGAVLAVDRLSLSVGSPTTWPDAVRREFPWQNATPLYLRSPSVTLKTYGNSDKANEPR